MNDINHYNKYKIKSLDGEWIVVINIVTNNTVKISLDTIL